MRCPTLAELPTPPAHRSGWPWTIETPALPATLPSGAPWPRISIIVASLGKSEYIEEMLRSALLQGYPELELILIDGGSASPTLDVITRYAPWLTYWISEPDRGQSHAINKGLARMTGTLFNMFDTDDFLLPGALALAAETHAWRPGAIVVGDVIRIWEGSPKTEVHFPEELDLHTYAQWWRTYHHGGPGMFFPATAYAKVGPVNEDLHYLMDYEYTCRCLAVAEIAAIRAPVATIRHNASSKSIGQSDRFTWECVQISRTYQEQFPDIAAAARRHGSHALMSAGLMRLARGEPDAGKFIREAWRTSPWWSIYSVFPGWFLRRLARLRRE